MDPPQAISLGRVNPDMKMSQLLTGGGLQPPPCPSPARGYPFGRVSRWDMREHVFHPDPFHTLAASI